MLPLPLPETEPEKLGLAPGCSVLSLPLPKTCNGVPGAGVSGSATGVSGWAGIDEPVPCWGFDPPETEPAKSG